jgi:hypothetical protein
MRQVFIGNGRASLPERLDDSGNLERVPNQDSVGYLRGNSESIRLPPQSLKCYR